MPRTALSGQASRPCIPASPESAVRPQVSVLLLAAWRPQTLNTYSDQFYHCRRQLKSRSQASASPAPCCAVRCIACNGNGAASAVIAGLDWVAANLQLPAVISMSLGATGVDTTMDAAVQAVLALGATVVVAAGNYNNGKPCLLPGGLTCSEILCIPCPRRLARGRRLSTCAWCQQARKGQGHACWQHAHVLASSLQRLAQPAWAGGGGRELTQRGSAACMQCLDLRLRWMLISEGVQTHAS